MKKRILALLLAIVMVVGILPAFASAASLSDVKLYVAKNTDAGLNGKVNIAISNNAGTIYLPGSADVSKLKLSWEGDGVTVKVGDTTYDSGEAPIPAAGSSATYTVIADTTASYTLTTMKGSSGVKAMFFNIDEEKGTIAAMNSDTNHETECWGSVSFQETDKESASDYYMSIKGRGNWTWRNCTKKPYNFTLYKTAEYSDKKKVEFIDGVETKKWSILANELDPSYLRNKVGYDIANELGIGLESESIDVWMNGEYLGMYLLTPKNDYKAPDDGFMVEIDNQSDEDQFTISNLRYTVKDKSDDIKIDDIKSYIQKAVNALTDTTSEKYLDYIDIDSWAKLYLLNELYKDHDVSTGSIFFTKKSMNAEDKLVAGPVWDLDNALGRTNTTMETLSDKTNEQSADGWYIDSVNNYYTSFFQLLGKHASFMQRVYEIYNEYKDTFEGTKGMIADVDAQSVIIADSAEMDFTFWSRTQTGCSNVSSETQTFGSGKYAVTYQKTDTWTAYVNNLKEYITKRLSFFSDKLTVAAPSGSISGKTVVAEGENLSLTADCTNANSYQWQSSSDGETWTDISGATSKTYTKSMTSAMNGLQYRCVVRNIGTTIDTSKITKAAASARTVLAPVTVTMAKTLGNTVFTVNKDSANGLGGNVKIGFTKSGNNYSGTLYLPGNAVTSNLKLSWDSEATVKIGETPYNSGEAPIPADGESVIYTVTLEGTTASFTVKTMQGSSGVEGMFLEIDESMGTIAAMNGDSNHETACYGTAAFGETDEYYISMKGRGNSTWSQKKKPYNITFYKESDYADTKKVSLIDGVESKKWSLLANYLDCTRMRNKIGYDLANELGIGLDSRFADVWINGEYLGNYLITPKSDYQVTKKGFILELDNKKEGTNGDPQFTLDGLKEPDNVYFSRFTVKNTGKELTWDTNEIKAWMQEAWNAIEKYDSEEYLDYIDLDSWAKMYLLNEVYRNIDVLSGSIFMHRDGTSESDKLIAGPVWDLDLAIGRTLTSNYSGMSTALQRAADNWYIDSINSSGTNYVCWFQELGKHPSFMKRVYELYNEYSDNFDALTGNAATLASQIDASIDLDASRWSEVVTGAGDYVSYASTYGSGTYAMNYVKTSTWENAVQNLKTYLSTRTKFFSDKLTVETPSAGTVSGETTVNVLAAMSLETSAEADGYQWQISSDNKTWENIEGATAKTFSGTALYTMDGKYIRCVAKNTGNTVNTTRVAKVTPAAATASESKQLTIDMTGHEHNYTPVVTKATCQHVGYTTHTCACGYYYVDSETELGDHEYEDGSCIHCGDPDPDYVKCEYDRSASLSAGKLVLTMGGTKVGEFTFAKSGNNWTIMGSDNRYLGFANNAFTYSTSPFAWTYSNGAFTTSVTSSSSRWSFWSWGSTTTTYYLTYSGGRFAASTNSSGSNTSFAVHEISNTHDFGAWKQVTGEEKHTHTCSRCGTVETKDCSYETNHTCVCGRVDPHLAYVTATFVTGEDASKAPDKQTVIKDEGLITKPSADPTRVGYRFDGWYADGAEEPFDFTKPLSSDVTITAKWNVCNHEFENGICKYCGYKDPNAVSKCEGDKKVSLSEDKLKMSLGGTEVGEFTFKKSGSGWTIQNSGGKYLGFANNAYAEATTGFAWTYSNGAFTTSVTSSSSRWSFWSWGSTTTTYYLIYSGGRFAVSINSNGSNAVFTKHVESDTHSFGSWTQAANEQHTRTCEVCGEVETENCSYGTDHYCAKCGRYDPSAATVTANVTVTSKTTGRSGMWGWLFGGSGTTTYTAAITTSAKGTSVSSVKYSTDNINWTTGTSYSSTQNITKLYVNVETPAGTFRFLYQEGSGTQPIK